MREVLGIPSEWTLRFPDQMTAASVWTAANNNCLFSFFTASCFPRSAPNTLPSCRSLLSAKQQNNKTDSLWSLHLQLLAAYLCCTYGLHTHFCEWHHLAAAGESHFLHFHSADYQPEQVEADLMNPNEEAWPLSAAAAAADDAISSQMSATHWISGDAAARMINQCWCSWVSWSSNSRIKILTEESNLLDTKLSCIFWI